MNSIKGYKETAIEWIGKIPNHWNVSKIGRHFKLERGRVISNLEISNNIGDYPVFSSQTKNNGELGKINSYDFEGEYVSWTTDGANAGTCFYREGKFNVTNVCGLISSFDLEIDYKFLSYYLNLGCKYFVRQDINPKLMNDMMAEIPFLVIPISEQKLISQYLEKKTKNIDQLIDSIQKKIDLIKEKKISYINKIVTQGLSQHVTFKKSGISWIGDIPIDWNLKRIKYLANIELSTVDRHQYQEEKKVFICHYPNVYNNEYISYETKLPKGTCSDLEYKKFALIKGDILLTKDSESPDDIGIPTYVLESLENTVCGYHLAVIRITDDSILPEFLYRFIESQCSKQYFYISSNGITRYGLNKSSIENLVLVYPDKKVQSYIVEKIQHLSSFSSASINLLERKISLLKEYRNSIIFEIVTGKIRISEEMT